MNRKQSLWTAIFCVILTLLMLTHEDQWQGSLLALCACFAMYLLGFSALSCLPQNLRYLRSRVFTTILVGQFSALLMIFFFSPAIYYFQNVFNLRFSLTPVMLIAVLCALIKFIQQMKAFRFPSYTLPVTGISVMLIVRFAVEYLRGGVAIFSLDLHQHLFYANHIYDSGHFVLTGRGTDILESYTKGMHLLVAIWTGLTHRNFSQTVLVLMPFLQGLMITMAILESVTSALFEKSEHKYILKGWLAVALPVIVLLLIYGMPFYYPIFELNSTGRLTSTAVMGFPILLALIGALDKNTSLTCAAVVTLPIFGALSAKFNPSLGINFLAFVVPLTFCVVALFPKFPLKGVIASAALVAGSIFIAISLLVFDGFYLNKILDANPGLQKFVYSRFDILTKNFGYATGVIIPQVEVGYYSSTGLEVSFEGLRDKITNAPYFSSLNEFLSEFIRGFIEVKMHPFNYIFLISSFCVPIVALTIRGLFLLSGPHQSFSRLNLREIWYIALASFFCQGCALVFVKTEEIILGHSPFENWLISLYTLSSQKYVIYFLINPITVSLAAGGLFKMLIEFIPRARRCVHFAPSFMFCACAIFFSSFPLISSFKAQGPFVIRQRTLRDFLEFERKAPPEIKNIATPSRYVFLESQHWLFPRQNEWPLLPYGKRNYFFNIELGASGLLHWSVYKRIFCEGTVEEARQILRELAITHAIVHDVNGEMDFKTTVEGAHICKHSLAQLGVETQPDHVFNESFAYARFNFK